ncbi:long-chain fatty acid--CoA ligase [Dactylosporangium maewongense]|uniref:Long-chain fatty acid--CoA ligase n=1 Tax=Dactylosporangium maewongense TaxID=634393 RepID=A0ABN2DHZ1_9ACTN
MSLNLADVLAESAQRFPDRTAVIGGAVRLTYRQLWDDARRWAGLLRGLGVRPGDRVGVLLPNVPDFPRAYYAVAAAGAVVVPLHALATPEETAYVLSHSRASHLVSGGVLWQNAVTAAHLAGVPLVDIETQLSAEGQAVGCLAAAAVGDSLDWPVPREPDDLAAVLYTSGTTGRPKGAMLTHLNLLLNTSVSRDLFGLRSDDVVLGCLPLFHTFGQTCAMNAAFRAGATLALMARFSGQAALDLLISEEVTVFMGVPTMYVTLLETARNDERRPGHLRLAVSGGASLPVAVLERFEEAFATKIYEGYGLTETSPVAAFNQPDFGCRPGTVGHPVWGVRVAVAAPESDQIELLPDGTAGEIVIRGHNVFAGYLDDPDATAVTVVDGWLRTGDIGVRDADGFISIVDRKKDLVIRGGFNVYPREVEEVLSRHPAVVQVAVIGLPDPTYGEEVCAVIVADQQAGVVQPEEIVTWAKERLGRHKYPRLVEFVEQMPIGPSGKVLKRELRDRYADAPGALTPPTG